MMWLIKETVQTQQLQEVNGVKAQAPLQAALPESSDQAWLRRFKAEENDDFKLNPNL